MKAGAGANEFLSDMLPDWLEQLLTPCSRPVRALGYLRELHNIKKRQRKWGSAWAPHFERSQAVIRTAIGQCPQHRKAVILGAGWLYDVPLADLSAAFREVILVDVVHPFRTRRRLRRFANVSALAADVTGTAEAVYRNAKVPGAALPNVIPALFGDDREIDLVASVNLLSQLPSLPERYLLRAGVHPPEAITAYARNLVANHLDYLRRSPGVVSLIADVEALTVTAAGRVVKRSSTTHGVELPWRGESWTWPLIPRSDVYPHYASHLLVAGIVNVKQAHA
jgi:hypothetical protein